MICNMPPGLPAADLAARNAGDVTLAKLLILVLASLQFAACTPYHGPITNAPYAGNGISR